MNRRVPLLATAGLLLIAMASPARADLSSRLGALADVNARGYLNPMSKALSTSLNSGIFQSGKVPLVGVNISLGVHVMGVNFADKDRTFIPTDPAGFSSTTPTPVPTITGGNASVSVPGAGGTTMSYPGGLDMKTFTVAAPELTVGSVMGTRAVVRWFSADLGSSDLGKLEMFGIGAQHSVSQYFKGLPVDLAGGIFYQTFKVSSGLLDTKSFHVDVTGSRKFGAVVTVEPYASLGFDTFSMDVAYTSNSNPADHIAFSMDRQSNVHLALGAQLQFALVRLHGELVSAANTGVAVGLSVGR